MVWCSEREGGREIHPCTFRRFVGSLWAPLERWMVHHLPGSDTASLLSRVGDAGNPVATNLLGGRLVGQTASNYSRGNQYHLWETSHGDREGETQGAKGEDIHKPCSMQDASCCGPVANRQVEGRVLPIPGCMLEDKGDVARGAMIQASGGVPGVGRNP